MNETSRCLQGREVARKVLVTHPRHRRLLQQHSNQLFLAMKKDMTYCMMHAPSITACMTMVWTRIFSCAQVSFTVIILVRVFLLPKAFLVVIACNTVGQGVKPINVGFIPANSHNRTWAGKDCRQSSICLPLESPHQGVCCTVLMMRARHPSRGISSWYLTTYLGTTVPTMRRTVVARLDQER